MAENTEKVKTGMFPVIALRDVVAFPHIMFHLEISEQTDLISAEHAIETDTPVFLVALKNPENNDPKSVKDFCQTGVVGRITGRKESNDGKTTITVEGIDRATMMTYYPDSVCAAVIARQQNENQDTPKVKQIHDRILATIESIAQFVPKFSKELSEKLREETDMSLFTDAIAFYLLVSPEHKQQVLDCRHLTRRMELLDKLLDMEIAVLQEDFRIHGRVREALEQNQREYYLREQLRIVKEELGMNEEDEEASEYLRLIAEKKLPKYVEERLVKEVGSQNHPPLAGSGLFRGRYFKRIFQRKRRSSGRRCDHRGRGQYGGRDPDELLAGIGETRRQGYFGWRQRPAPLCGRRKRSGRYHRLGACSRGVPGHGVPSGGRKHDCCERP